MSYVEYLKGEVKRLKTALGYYEKMEKANKEIKKSYYREGAKACLRAHEEVDLIPQMFTEFKDSLEAREEHIKKLYSEVKQIKKLTV